MRLHRRRMRRGSGAVSVHIAPMIDVVFLLLIYFMIATDFSPAEEVFRMDLPPQAGKVADALELYEEPLKIGLAAAGADSSGVRVRVQGPWEVSSSIDALREFLDSSTAPQGSLFLPDHPIIIVPTSSVQWGHVVAAFNAAVASGCTNVTLEPPT